MIDYLIREEMTNPAGRLHGGIQCAMLDDVIGLAAYTLGRDGFHLSVNLATDYLGRADAGEVVRAEGRGRDRPSWSSDGPRQGRAQHPRR